MTRAPRLLLAAWLAVGAAGAGAAQVGGIAVEYKAGTFSVRGTFGIDAPPEAVRAALTDFDHLERLTPAILASRVVGHDGAGTLVYSRSRACAGWFCRELEKVERVTVDGEWIVATALPARSNVTMSVTRWRITPLASGTRVAWESTFDPAFFVPPLVGPALIKRALQREATVHADALERAARAAAAHGG